MKNVQALYRNENGCGCRQLPVAIELSDWASTIERLAKEMHEGRLKPEDLDVGLIKSTYSELSGAAKAGFGKDWLKVNKDTGAPDPAALKMQQNLYKFSGVKTYAQLEELNRILTKGGQRLGWEQFKSEALKMNEKYNLNHLQAEWQTANQSGQMAVNWREYQRNKNNFPNLKLCTQKDYDVRPEHATMDGIIAPIDSDFWKKYYPPNGWRCRCYVKQTAEKATQNIPENMPGVRDEFKINVGISGQVFSEEAKNGAEAHSYFALAKSSGQKLQQRLEKAKFNAPYEEVYKAKNGASVLVSPFADLSDFPANFKTAKVIADQLSTSVSIRPHLDRTLVPGKNPEYEIRKKLGDRKGIKSVKGVLDAIDSAKAQMMDANTNPTGDSYIIVLDLSAIEKLSLTELKTNLNRKINKTRGKHIESVFFTNGNRAVELTREEIVSRQYSKLDKIQ